ncbi:MAG TPA: SDR family NAD(P)-dependent oxidoreductase [Ktedonobacterales bacterium]
MGELDGRVALVTGGGRGLGAATALALAEAGADVAVVGRTEAPLAEVAERVRALGRRAAYAVADMAQWKLVRAAVSQVETALGPIAILVNNAAVAGPIARVADLDPAAWDHNLAINLNGPFYAVHATLSGMLARGWGRILNVSSGSAVNAAPGMAAYSAAKAGLNHFTRILAAELEGTGVVPVCIGPGTMDTEMQAEARAVPIPESEMFRTFQRQGMLRPPSESAALLCWLCGPDAAEFAGEFISVFSSAIRARVGLAELPEPMRRP